MKLVNQHENAHALIEFAELDLGLSESDTAAALIMAAGILAGGNCDNVFTIIKSVIDIHKIVREDNE
jgi:hypothetical protein